MNRRSAILFLLSTLIAAQTTAGSKAAWADDGGGSDDGGSDGGSDSGGSSGSSGDDSGDDSGSGSGTSDGSNSHSESDSIQEAVEHGKAVSLKNLLDFVKANYEGKVINVELKKIGPNFAYKVKLLTPDNTLKVLNLDALTMTATGSAAIY